MAVRSYQPRTLYHAECDECRAIGPERDTEREAVEAVTADAVSRRAGFRVSGCWTWVDAGARLLCSRCAKKRTLEGC